jgi:starch phosphorylase
MPQRVTVPTIPAASFRLPPQLEGLRALAYNLYWAWHPRARGIWSRIDRRAWNRHRNPVPVLAGAVEWGPLLDDTSFMAEVREVLREFERYMTNGADKWYLRHHADGLPGPVAYFCAEYGLQ